MSRHRETITNSFSCLALHWYYISISTFILGLFVIRISWKYFQKDLKHLLLCTCIYIFIKNFKCLFEPVSVLTIIIPIGKALYFVKSVEIVFIGHNKAKIYAWQAEESKNISLKTCSYVFQLVKPHWAYVYLYH